MLHQSDKRVMAIIYDQYSPALYGVVLRIVHSEAIAEDVMQDAFIKIWKNGTTYDRSKGTLFTWMLNITRNTAIDKVRSKSYRNGEKIQTLDHHVYNQASQNHSIKPEEVGLKELLNGLDPKYKKVVDMIYFGGFTQKEVSEHLNIPLGTVKTRLRIALRELRTMFDVSNVIGLLLFINATVYF
ncbi:MAG: RNA polymerase sigma factor [Bacteroidota bacterium]